MKVWWVPGVLPKFVAISQKYCQPLLTLEVESYKKQWQKLATQSRGLVAKVKDTVTNDLLIWLVCREPLDHTLTYMAMCYLLINSNR